MTPMHVNLLCCLLGMLAFVVLVLAFRYVRSYMHPWPNTVQDLDGFTYELRNDALRQNLIRGNFREAKRKDLKQIFESKFKSGCVPGYHGSEDLTPASYFDWRTYVKDYQLHVGCKHFGDEATRHIEHWARSGR